MKIGDKIICPFCGHIGTLREENSADIKWHICKLKGEKMKGESNNMKNYVGKFCFLEKKKSGDTYNNGEYFIIRQSPFNLYGIKCGGGYDSHHAQCFPMEGESAWLVIEARENPAFAKEVVLDLYKFSLEKNQPKKQWVDSVYNGAYANAARIAEILDIPFPPGKNVVEHTITINDSRTIEHKNATVVLSSVLNGLIDKVDLCHREKVRNIVERIFYEFAYLR